jgi:hypothetical protein
MIVDQKNQDVHTVPEFSAFSKFVSLPNALFRACKAKSQGFELLKIFQTLFFLVFQQRNFWRVSVNSKSALEFSRDTVYRFLNSPWHNWRHFLNLIARKVIFFFRTLTSDDKRKVFVVDDSSFNKNCSKKVELISKIYDHVEKRYLRGFRLLTLAFTDGVSLIPIDFSLLSSQKHLCPVNSDIDKRSHGWKRRLEALKTAPDVLLDMIDGAVDIITKGSYIVFDSWFCVPSLIRRIQERGLHVTGRLKNDQTYFLFRRNSKNTFVTLGMLFRKLDKIPAKVRRRQQQTPDILGSLCVALPAVEGYEALPVRIVFLKNKNAPQDWVAILTTDLQLTEEEVVIMYTKRWKIEEFFKVAKSLLKLEGEFQGRSYDMLVTHTTLVCTRYIFLELERRRSKDIRTCGELFYYCCDELVDLKVREAIAVIFEALKSFFQKYCPNSTKKNLKDFMAFIPAHILDLLDTSRCKS